MKKKWLSVLIAAVLLCTCLPIGGVSAAAQEKTYRQMTYIVTADGVTITGCEKDVTEVVIPMDIGGKPICGIGSGAFADCANLTTITFYCIVEDVAPDAFTGCNRICYVNYRGPDLENYWYGNAELWDAVWSYSNPGDANDDGKLNNRDLALLQRHLNEYEVEILSEECDMNGDGKLNNRDLGLLQRRLNGMDEGDDDDSFFNDGSFAGWEQLLKS